MAALKIKKQPHLWEYICGHVAGGITLDEEERVEACINNDLTTDGAILKRNRRVQRLWKIRIIQQAWMIPHQQMEAHKNQQHRHTQKSPRTTQQTPRLKKIEKHGMWKKILRRHKTPYRRRGTLLLHKGKRHLQSLNRIWKYHKFFPPPLQLRAYPSPLGKFNECSEMLVKVVQVLDRLGKTFRELKETKKLPPA